MATHLYLSGNNEQSKNNLFCLFRNLCRSWWEQMSTICHLQLWSMGCSMKYNNSSINRSNNSNSSRMGREYQHPPGLWPSPTTRCQAWQTQWTPSSTTLPSLSTLRFIPQIFIHCVWTAGTIHSKKYEWVMTRNIPQENVEDILNQQAEMLSNGVKGYVNIQCVNRQKDKHCGIILFSA